MSNLLLLFQLHLDYLLSSHRYLTLQLTYLLYREIFLW